MGLTRTTDAATEPVTLAEARLHTKQDSDITADDALITALIKAARETVENITGRALITQTWRLTLDEFPGDGVIWVPRPNLIAVSSITYKDVDGNTQTLASNQYVADVDSLPGRIHRAYNVSWPNVRGDANCITITFTAGYGAAAAVPESYKAAIKLLVGNWYENREQSVAGGLSEIPMGVQALLGGYRVVEAV